MDRTGKVTRRRHLRKIRQNEKRQSLLVADYIQHKYFNVYSEALHFYTMLNNRHPSKPDLRKTDEYKFWKFGVPHVIEPPQNHLLLTNQDQQESQQPTTECSEQELPPTSPASSNHESQPPSPASNNQESQPPSPASSEQQESQPPSPASSEQQESQSPGQHIYTDNLQLRIPIHRYRTVKHGHSITTQTLSIVTDQVLEESTQEQPSTVQIPQVETFQPPVTDQVLEESTQEQPSMVQIPQVETFQPPLFEELPSDIIQEVIDQLREDPDLLNMFNTIEEQLEFEELGMDIEIPEDNLLEKELENW